MTFKLNRIEQTVFALNAVLPCTRFNKSMHMLCVLWADYKKMRDGSRPLDSTISSQVKNKVSIYKCGQTWLLTKILSVGYFLDIRLIYCFKLEPSFYAWINENLDHYSTQSSNLISHILHSSLKNNMMLSTAGVIIHLKSHLLK